MKWIDLVVVDRFSVLNFFFSEYTVVIYSMMNLRVFRVGFLPSNYANPIWYGGEFCTAVLTPSSFATPMYCLYSNCSIVWLTENHILWLKAIVLDFSYTSWMYNITVFFGLIFLSFDRKVLYIFERESFLSKNVSSEKFNVCIECFTCLYALK